MNGNCLIHLRIKHVLLIVACCLVQITMVKAQADSVQRMDPIQVVAMPSRDSIVLRWAPIATRYWIDANKRGYLIERYTLVRDGRALSKPEKRVLTPTSLRPYTEEQWIPVVQNNKYAAIAAQALLGDKFELDMKQGGDVFSIVNKVKENDQRFSIALFCADLSVITAKALGLYYVDRNVKKGEKYLYRITVPGEDKLFRGSIYIDPYDKYVLPAPTEFSIQTQGPVVALKWNQLNNIRIYTAYKVERSEDGKIFKGLTEDPVTMLTNTQESKYAYAIDTLRDIGKQYYYRVRGISPFGEYGTPSDTLTAEGRQMITEAPHITAAESTDNKTIVVTWDFPQQLNSAIEGFDVERSPTHSGTYAKIHDKILAKETRSFLDSSPEQTNYYRVTALGLDKTQVRSMIYFTHLVDSFPPAPPAGFTNTVDEHGNVTLTWKPNTELDIYGYRVYRANYLQEEFAQLTVAPIPNATFTDKVILHSLNEKVHYRVMAIDRNQNHSVLSEIYTVQLPDKVPPMPPVFLPVKSSNDGVVLAWIRSSSTDVAKYDIFRKGEANQWIRLATVQHTGDSVYTYKDMTLKNGEERHYTVIAIDEANLESQPSPPVLGQRIRKAVYPAVTIGEPVVDKTKNKVLLKWTYTEPYIKMFHVYRSMNDEPLKLYKAITGSEFADSIVPGSKYQYKVVAVFIDGARSEMGKGLVFMY
jgi:fibronectin type 3 domain-containing protein